MKKIDYFNIFKVNIKENGIKSLKKYLIEIHLNVLKDIEGLIPAV